MPIAVCEDTYFMITSGLTSSFIILHHITLWPIVVKGRWQHRRERVPCVLGGVCLSVCRRLHLVSGAVTRLSVPACAKCSQLAETKLLVSLDKLLPSPGQTGNKPRGLAGYWLGYCNHEEER